MRSLFLALALAPGLLIAAPEPSALEAALSKPILDPNQPLVDVQVYTASRVLPLQPPASAAAWRQQAETLRRRVLDEVVFRGEAKAWRTAKTRVEWLDTLPGKGYRIRKLRFEALPGLWIPALLYEPENLTGKVPAVLNVNGHEKDGTAIPYIQERCINIAKRGMLALNPEWLGRGQWQNDQAWAHTRMNQIDLTGTSGLAVFYLSLQRSLDILVSHANTDRDRVAVTGLSGGGWQTITLSALDLRVKLANPVAGYSSFVTRTQFPTLDLGDSEQTPSDLGSIVDYTHLTAMLAPRPSLLTYNAKDSCCFRAEYAVAPLVQQANPVFRLLDAMRSLRYHVNHDDGHNYGQDNREAFYRMLRDFFYAGSDKFPVEEIPSADEVRTAEQLRIPLPDNNHNFRTLALELSRSLPKPAAKPDRARLAKIVRSKQLTLEAVKSGSDQVNGLEVTRWKLLMGAGDWSVPAVEISPASPKSTVILVSDEGRAKAAAQVERLTGEGKRVIAIDPFYFGESKIAKRDWLFAILVASLGERPLGVQASQVMAAARWLETRGVGPVEIVSDGPRSSLFSLVAAALEPKAIRGLEPHGELASLKEIIERDMTADNTPELFCFGLLSEFDIPQIRSLIASR